ncbi:hypothetical protein SSX86_012514 [Deinandra increscens subsp. villosa]|uniref:Reverse transcriptase zinc-binding domain-containing protein n=1 Tax=Deinandra increscens subsp. villosa TaxID=3103831 RepID=A0AAP0H0Q0_9ASTR
MGIHGGNSTPNWIPVNKSVTGVWKNIASIENILNKTNVRLKNLLVCESHQWNWVLEPSGTFSSKSLKDLLSKSADSPQKWLVWTNLIPLKVNLVMWRAQLCRLPTLDGLIRRNILVGSDVCPLCSSAIETVEHLFTGCEIALDIWSQISSWCKIPQLFCFSMEDLAQIHNNLRGCKSKAMVVQAIIHTACWVLWKARNDAVFNKKKIVTQKIFTDIKTLSFHWVSNRCKMGVGTWENWCNFDFQM